MWTRGLSALAAAGLAIIAGTQPARAQVTVSMETGRLLANDGLRAGQFRWEPEAATAEGLLRIVVSLGLQRAYVFRGTTLIGVSSVSTGQPGWETPMGRFTILQKQVDHYSSIYENAPMPFMQRLTVDGIALHAGTIPRSGEPVSHGCIRLPRAFAQRLYGMTALGTMVVITDQAPDVPQDALAYLETN